MINIMILRRQLQSYRLFIDKYINYVIMKLRNENYIVATGKSVYFFALLQFYSAFLSLQTVFLFC